MLCHMACHHDHVSDHSPHAVPCLHFTVANGLMVYHPQYILCDYGSLQHSIENYSSLLSLWRFVLLLIMPEFYIMMDNNTQHCYNAKKFNTRVPFIHMDYLYFIVHLLSPKLSFTLQNYFTDPVNIFHT